MGIYCGDVVGFMSLLHCGRPTVCYQNWPPGNGTSEEDCEHTVRSGAVQSGGDQRWISRPETDKLNFICSTY
ncbi:hypothetical protein H4Q32_029125 [Labeo rohita]|uniref:Uncharacterized protein n=1 Tax=Labeo rohita TaxID=84645 RepID=A0ABQ8LAL7_LABRO|nr:hypothetical protein H4Q32_029125 [Labeo rohita]